MYLSKPFTKSIKVGLTITFIIRRNSKISQYHFLVPCKQNDDLVYIVLHMPCFIPPYYLNKEDDCFFPNICVQKKIWYKSDICFEHISLNNKYTV